MSDLDVAVPDLGNFDEVAVVEVLVNVGDAIEIDTPLLTLETEKATMDVPSPAAGKLTAVLVKAGDKVRKGSVIARVAAAEGAAPAAKPAAPAAPAAAAAPAATPATSAAPAAAAPAATHAPAPAEKPLMPPGPTPERTVPLLVLGAGPGGYTAAFRAADLGMKVVLIERWETLGGVCLNVGCIPSKALLHAAKVIEEAHDMSAHGLAFGAPAIDVDKLRKWKEGVVGRLTGASTAWPRRARWKWCGALAGSWAAALWK